MTREKAVQNIKSNYLQTITTAVAIIGLVTAMANVWLVAHIAPLAQSIAVLTETVKANDDRDIREHPSFVTQAQFTIHQDQINRMEDKIDKIYTILK